jgi:ribosomal protein L35
MKTNKSYTKRIRVTKKGKLVARKSGQNHFNAKEGGRTKGVKGRTQNLVVSKDIRRRFLSTPSK